MCNIVTLSQHISNSFIYLALKTNFVDHSFSPQETLKKITFNVMKSIKE